MTASSFVPGSTSPTPPAAPLPGPAVANRDSSGTRVAWRSAETGELHVHDFDDAERAASYAVGCLTATAPVNRPAWVRVEPLAVAS